MNKELQEKLFSKYPKIFRQKDLSTKESCMANGIQCGDGWYNIIDVLCHTIKLYLERKNKSDKSHNVIRLVPSSSINIMFEAVQIKEKFGALRFYYDGGDDTIAEIVSYAESLSLVTCSKCGRPAQAYSSGWLNTLCSKCKEIFINDRVQ
jgi:hypothetical protein